MKWEYEPFAVYCSGGAGADEIADTIESFVALGVAATINGYPVPLSQLGLSKRALNTLSRHGVNSLGELLAVGTLRLQRLRGVGDKLAFEIGTALQRRTISAAAQTGEQPNDRPAALRSHVRLP